MKMMGVIMKIMINALLEYDKDNTLVHFLSDIGNSRALWIGKLPDVGSYYDVEIEISDTLVWGENIVHSKHTIWKIEDNGSEVIIIGQIIKVEGEIVYLNLSNSIVLIEVSNPQYVKECFVEIKIKYPIIYDTRI
jgi:hypothetical protein